MKKVLYITLFILLGIIVSFLLHGALELDAIYFLTHDFQTYNFGLSWGEWFTIHEVGSMVLLVAGVLFGFFQGRCWWQKNLTVDN